MTLDNFVEKHGVVSTLYTEAKCFVLDSGACHYSKSSAPKAIQGHTIKNCFYVYSCKQCAAGLTLSDFTKAKGCKKKR